MQISSVWLLSIFTNGTHPFNHYQVKKQKVTIVPESSCVLAQSRPSCYLPHSEFQHCRLVVLDFEIYVKRIKLYIDSLGSRFFDLIVCLRDGHAFCFEPQIIREYTTFIKQELGAVTKLQLKNQ